MRACTRIYALHAVGIVLGTGDCIYVCDRRAANASITTADALREKNGERARLGRITALRRDRYWKGKITRKPRREKRRMNAMIERMK
ncbi:hypothetical protein BD310DRAFT_573163 [Dichomitus squalens]|uniref:Uncharacterized protein n=1 Tax=Dichomitus squalens TaxID=114155 RepID=A0A4Q9PRP5_9APHY|nr:hypothetical protein BD310DRAFT_573163 [Dichomitus squalens]